MTAILLIGVATADGVAAAEPDAAADKPIVRLVIDYGDGVQKHFTQLRWKDGATVYSQLQDATRHPRGIRTQQRGKGATLLVTQIDDVGNEGAAGTGRNWIFRVNGEIGERSAAICPLAAGDTVLWSFETYR